MKVKEICDGCRWDIINQLGPEIKASSRGCDNYKLIHDFAIMRLDCRLLYAIKLLSSEYSNYIDALNEFNNQP